MQEFKDHYRTLGIPVHASAEEVKRAYRALARACHPDHHPGDRAAAERFKNVQEAYAVLSDVERRRQYDSHRPGSFSVFGHVHATAFSGPSAFATNGAGAFGGNGFGPLFDEAPAPRCTEIPVHLSFEQALRGGKAAVRLPDGRCARIAVPCGVRNGLKVRLRSRGDADGEADGFCVTFHVAPSARFRRDGDDLHLTERITAVEAMLGTTRTVTNAYGRTLTLTIPPGTQPGHRFRLRGQGVQTARQTGDLFVEVAVEVPRALTEAQREQIRQAARDAGLL